MTLIRSMTHYPSVTSKLLPDGIGLVQIPAMESGKAKEITAQIDSLIKQGAKKLILDMRNSGVGKAEDGVAIANLFLDKGLITYAQGQKVKRQDFNAAPEKALYKSQPIVVITNRGTASAAEIVAASLLDSKRADIVGERTYGDAAIRKAVTMDDGAAVILSVAKFYSPSGKAIQDTGVTPTVMVTEADTLVDTEEGQESPNAPEQQKKDKDEDLLLKKAVEVLTKGKPASGIPTSSAGKPEDRLNAPNPLLK